MHGVHSAAGSDMHRMNSVDFRRKRRPLEKALNNAADNTFRVATAHALMSRAILNCLTLRPPPVRYGGSCVIKQTGLALSLTIQ